jgi:hypothetical protein
MADAIPIPNEERTSVRGRHAIFGRPLADFFRNTDLRTTASSQSDYEAQKKRFADLAKAINILNCKLFSRGTIVEERDIDPLLQIALCKSTRTSAMEQVRIK